MSAPLESTLEALREELRLMRLEVQGLRAEVGRPAKRLFSYREAAEALGVSTKMVQRMVRQGELLPVFIGAKPLITRADLDRLSAPPKAKSSGATAQQTRFDAVAATKRLNELRKKR